MIFGRDIGIDLGTSTVVVTLKGKGIITREPAVVAMDRNTGRLLKVGLAAQRMLGRTPGNIVAIKPLSGGVISDYDMTEKMLKEMVRKATAFSFLKPRLVISVPSGITEVEERAVIDAGLQAGGRKVYLIEEPVAAALGTGLDISKPEGLMVVDIGAGTTDVAVISMSGVVMSQSIKTAGDSFNDAIIRYIKKEHSVLIGDTTAEELKRTLGGVYPREEEAAPLEVKGRCLLSGLPRVVAITAEDIIEAFEEVTQSILDAIHQVLEKTPPELVSDISDNGIVLTGGGSLLWGMDRLIESSTGIKTHVADDAELTVAYGIAKALSWVNQMQEGTLNLYRKRQMRE